MFVYRIEHPSDGNGPYKTELQFKSDEFNRWQWDVLAKKHTPDNPRTLNPVADIPDAFVKVKARGRYMFEYTFGFQRLRDCKSWFGDVWEDLSKFGFQLVKYKVKAADVLIGGHQVAFYKDGAVKLNSKPL